MYTLVIQTTGDGIIIDIVIQKAGLRICKLLGHRHINMSMFLAQPVVRPYQRVSEEIERAYA
jgi:hypothetical protein